MRAPLMTEGRLATYLREREWRERSQWKVFQLRGLRDRRRQPHAMVQALLLPRFISIPHPPSENLHTSCLTHVGCALPVQLIVTEESLSTLR
jgi:hypothetical protein